MSNKNSDNQLKLSVMIALVIILVVFVVIPDGPPSSMNSKTSLVKVEKSEKNQARESSSRAPASAPNIDSTTGSGRRVDLIRPRKPAQVSGVSTDQLVTEWRTTPVQISGKKFQKVMDAVVINRTVAEEWGLPVRGHLFNQTIIDKSELPRGVKFNQLIYSERTFSYSILTNNVVVKFKNNEAYQTFLHLQKERNVLGSFAPIRLVIVEATNESDAEKIYNSLKSDSNVERVQIEIIDQSKEPR